MYNVRLYYDGYDDELIVIDNKFEKKEDAIKFIFDAKMDDMNCRAKLEEIEEPI